MLKVAPKRNRCLAQQSLLDVQEDVRNIEMGKVPLPKYMASAEPASAPAGVRTSIYLLFFVSYRMSWLLAETVSSSTLSSSHDRDAIW